MKPLPILFKAPMVRAILDGRKHQTRRLVKPKEHLDSFTAKSGWYPDRYNHGTGWCMWGSSGTPDNGKMGAWIGQCPYGEPGGLLYLKETWSTVEVAERETRVRTVYRADGDPHDPFSGDVIQGVKWRPSIYMPREASRITLRVTDVRVERLQDISEEDARWEGVGLVLANEMGALKEAMTRAVSKSRRAGFKLLWESINGAGAWDANHWVWRVAFERVTP